MRTHKNMDEIERKAKLTTAQEAYSKIKAGEDFANIATQYSEDTVSGKKGGDIGWVTSDAVDKRFSEIVFAMKKDQVSEPFETQYGYHIAKLLEESVMVKQPLEAVKGNIRYSLRKQAKQAEIDRLQNKIKIKR